MRKHSLLRLMLPVLALMLLCGCKKDYNKMMSKADLTAADGTKIVAYNLKEQVYNDIYADIYIPEALRAAEPEEVGYILRYDYGVDSTSCMYTGGTKYGDYVRYELVDCSTGEVLAERTFAPSFPKVTSDLKARAIPSGAEVQTWISHYYPDWPAGEAPEHEWQEADCRTPKTCTGCGKVEGGTVCHIYSEGKCAVCAEKLESEWACHTLEWEVDPELVAEMSARCAVCAKEYTAETDWNLFAGTLPAGVWKMTHYFKGDTLVHNKQEVLLTFREDGTALLKTKDGDHSFSWTFKRGRTNENLPALMDLSYDAVDAEGNAYDMSYTTYASTPEIYIRCKSVDASLYFRYKGAE